MSDKAQNSANRATQAATSRGYADAERLRTVWLDRVRATPLPSG